ncbi:MULTISPECIES: hypothetical protein [Vibrio diabolicus subgroup]|uniref:hypothetical protein n=1 Tax=Vibrio diabolicus subgroup TaxID=2315253 RepID=UPI000A193089|nr:MULTISPECIES: hypothetical protein [Vibrio diabolicus subgroup]MEA3481557.1 hypothetical protein [Pseudomonadota bacterium]MCR9470693.1 hypothetical protein [Vibrio diabolicus]MCS0326509.1 hypothetical protein [Vibrio diabolicus]MCS0345815.1 hypothetical protein [Vibrio diabolicus]MCS0358309.1 hypothetical protein [Vibrio diabolicus]
MIKVPMLVMINRRKNRLKYVNSDLIQGGKSTFHRFLRRGIIIIMVGGLSTASSTVFAHFIAGVFDVDMNVHPESLEEKVHALLFVSVSLVFYLFSALISLNISGWLIMKLKI